MKNFNHPNSNPKLSQKTLSPKLDVVFQALFGERGSELITKRFLQSILDNPIHQIELNVNPILRREYENDKLGILDLLAKINETENCNIEIQVIEPKNILERILYYWSRLYCRELKKRKRLQRIKKSNCSINS